MLLHIDCTLIQGTIQWELRRGHYYERSINVFRDAESVFALLVMVSIGALKRTLAGKTIHQNGSIDTSFGPPQFSLDSIIKKEKSK